HARRTRPRTGRWRASTLSFAKSDALPRRWWRRHELSERIEDDAELRIVFPLELIDLFHQSFRRIVRPSQQLGPRRVGRVRRGPAGVCRAEPPRLAGRLPLHEFLHALPVADFGSVDVAA